MSTVWIVSLVLAWVVIALLVASVIVLLRQLGEVRARLDAGVVGAAPADTADAGVALYDAVEPTTMTLLHDGGTGLSAIPLGGDAQAEPLLLVVHGPGCESCEGVEEALEALAVERPQARLVSVLALREDAAREHVAERPLAGVPTIGFEQLPEPLRPELTPSAIGVTREGIVAALGGPSTLDALREAAAISANAVLIGAPDSIRATGWGTAVPAWGVDGEDPDLLDVVHVDPTDPHPTHPELHDVR